MATSFSLAPVPVARLWAGPVVVLRRQGLGWAEEEVLAPLLDVWLDDGAGRHRLRDAACGPWTAAARRALEQLGALEVDDAGVLPPPDSDPDYVVGVDGETGDFCAFTAQAVPKLRALGWHVDVDPRYPYGVAPPSSVAPFATVAPHAKRPDWFSLELGVTVGGRTFDLLPLVLDVLADAEEGSLRELERRLRSPAWLRVSATEHALVPPEIVHAFVRVALELHQGRRRPGEPIAFPAACAPALARLHRALGERLRAPAPLLERVRQAAAPPPDVVPPAGLRAELRPYQRAGVAFLQHAGRAGGCVLADDMGLGKTLQTIAHLALEKEARRLDRPALVVGPTSLAWNWTRELRRFAPHLRVTLVHGPKRRAAWAHAPSSDVVVTTYPVLVRDARRFSAERFSWLVLDEAQTVKNARSDVHRVVRALRRERTIALSGTPVENDLGELWSILELARPGLLGDERAFKERFRVPIEQRGDQERLAMLRERVAPHLLRRTKAEVAKDLPPKTELLVPVELGGAQRELYEHIRVAAHAEVRRVIRAKGLARSTIPILGALMKLRQVCCDPRLVSLEAAREVGESAKHAAFFALLEAQLAEGRRALVFSQFTSMLALLARGLEERRVRHVALTGETRDRRAVVDAFERGDAEVMLVSLKAGGTGLNLVAADTVIHYDPWWNPAAEAQATDRAHRIGQTKPVFVHKLYAAGTVEERVLDLQRRKAWLARALLGDASEAGAFTPRDLESLFAPIG